MQIERKVMLVTEQHNIPKDSPVPEFPMKEWSVKIFLLDQAGNKHPANVFTKAVYNLHPSFEKPQQTFTEPPFTCTNEGWGEFEMSIDLYTTEKAKSTLFHDLNFQKPTYELPQSVTFKNPSQALIALLRETGPVGDDDLKAAKIRKGADGKKRKVGFDYEKIADAMTKLDEDALLHVIQMIHDNKTDDTYTNNDLEAGEFTVDLYSLPDPLTKMLWDFLVRIDMFMVAFCQASTG
ncbi:transcription initiation factor IIF-like protein [Xylariaceae sp. FL0016]|nr:transcription initiation factor IIF-like protein [Xylariaceae sp. FL0016]